MGASVKKTILILGSGFGGLYAALELDWEYSSPRKQLID
jgi:NADH dehydrogenase FAD-containing subunit